MEEDLSDGHPREVHDFVEAREEAHLSCVMAFSAWIQSCEHHNCKVVPYLVPDRNRLPVLILLGMWQQGSIVPM